MKRKAIIPLVLGLGVGIVTVKLAVDTIREARAANKPTETITLVWARQDIGAHQEITPEMVELVETPDSLLAPAGDRLEELELVVGRVTAKSVPQHVPVLQSMLAPKGTRAGMVGRIPAGFRAVSVKIDEVTGVSYQLQPGDWVDVIVVMDIDGAVRGRRETIAEVILQHVQVAAIGFASNAQEGGGPSKVKPARSATLLVAEQDVPKLHLAATRGKITLAMRGDDKTTTPDGVVAYGSRLFGVQRGMKTSPAPKQTDRMAAPQYVPEPHNVIVYRGSVAGDRVTMIERITFEDKNSSRIIDFREGPPTRASSQMGPSRRPGVVRQSDLRRPNRGNNQSRPYNGK